MGGRHAVAWGETFRQLGNAVPVSVAKLITDQIASAILGMKVKETPFRDFCDRTAEVDLHGARATGVASNAGTSKIVRSSRRVLRGVADREDVIVRRLKVSTFVTLDGVMQAPGGPDEDRSGGFTKGGWSVGYWDDRMGQVMGDFMGRPFEMLLGRRTYEIFAAYWPRSTEAGAQALNGARKHVASRTLKNVEWNNSTLIKGDVPMYVSELKKQSGPEIQVHGSGDLLQTLIAHDLVDEYRLWIYPVVLGKGRRLFTDGLPPKKFEHVETRTTSTGVNVLVLRANGTPDFESFGLPD